MVALLTTGSVITPESVTTSTSTTEPGAFTSKIRSAVAWIGTRGGTAYSSSSTVFLPANAGYHAASPPFHLDASGGPVAADADQIGPSRRRLGEQLVDHARRLLDDRFGVLIEIDGARFQGEDTPVFVDGCRLEVGSTQIDPDRRRRGHVAFRLSAIGGSETTCTS